MQDPDARSPAFYSVAIQGEDDAEPQFFKPIAHSSGAALARILEQMDREGKVAIGKFQYYVQPGRRVGGYDSPDIERLMRSRTVLENGENDEPTDN